MGAFGPPIPEEGTVGFENMLDYLMSPPGQAQLAQGGSPGGQGTLQLVSNQILGNEDVYAAFLEWAITEGVPNADPENLSQVGRFVEWSQQQAAQAEQESRSRSGSAGRTQFPSEAAVDFAQAGLLGQQAQTEQFSRSLAINEFMEAQRVSAFDRAQSRLERLQAAEELRDARRESAVNALISAAPYMVPPGQQYIAGLEPGGAGQVLGGLLGANVQPARLPTADLPLHDLANAPGVDRAEINRALGPLLGIPEQPPLPTP